MAITKAIAYIRFSTTRQELGDSERRQLENINRVCEANGWEIVEELHDYGKSAFSGKHIESGALGDFISRIDSSGYSDEYVLVLSETSRISRLDANVARDQILRPILQVMPIHICKLNTTYNRLGKFDLVGEIQLLLDLDVSNRESETKSAMILSKFEYKRKQIVDKKEVIRSQHRPFFIDGELVDGKAVYTLNPHSETVRTIFNLRLEGYGINTIRDKLEALEVPIPESFRVEQYDFRTIRRILKLTPATYGALKLSIPFTTEEKRIRKMKGLSVDHSQQSYTLVEDFYPAVVTKEEWGICSVVDKQLVKGRRTPEFNNILRGLAKCGYCGSPYTVKQGSNASYLYLHCNNRASDVRACPSPKTIKNHVLFPSLLSQVAHLPLNGGRIDKDEIAMLQLKREEINTEIENGLTAITSLSPALQGSLIERIQKKETELAETVARLNELNHALSFSNENLLANLDKLKIDTPQQREEVNKILRRALLKVVIFAERGTFDVHLKSGDVIKDLLIDGTHIERLQALSKTQDEDAILDAIESGKDDFAEEFKDTPSDVPNVRERAAQHAEDAKRLKAEGLKPKAIAEKLNIPLPTVYRYLKK